jgi:hypothetical protein
MTPAMLHDNMTPMEISYMMLATAFKADWRGVTKYNLDVSNRRGSF